MAFLKFHNVGIRAMAAAVPRQVIDNARHTQYFPDDEVRSVVDKTGIRERRFADAHTCSSDLCYAAAERLMAYNRVDRGEIDLLIFLSPTPDFRMPPTSLCLQARLGLSTGTIAFDVPVACSAFLYGLTIAYSMLAANATLRKALVLYGDTPSKVYSPRDRRVAFLFGDGAAAALVERGEQYGPSFFSLNSDGGIGDLIKIDAGGYRMPSSEETLREKVIDEYGNVRSEEQAYMKGADVFAFVIKEIPADIRALCKWAGTDVSSMDFYIFHQANGFINHHLVKKMGLDVAKVPETISKYGNTSSASVPLTIVDQLGGGRLRGTHRLLLSAFGVGMTWGTGIVQLHDPVISPVVEV